MVRSLKSTSLKKTGYKLTDAKALLEEYRRFVYLCVIAPGQMRPSSYVDEVWHIHLTVTQDYWDRFCPDVLGRKLHHIPGGPAPKDDPQFEETLALYEAEFGVTPLERYWRAIRFQEVLDLAQFVLWVACIGGLIFERTDIAIIGGIGALGIYLWLWDRRPRRKGISSGGSCGDGGGCGGD